jgi:hypothetical protein
MLSVAYPGRFVYLFRLYQGEGDVPIQRNVVGEVDPLLAALAEEPLDLVAAAGEGCGLGGRRRLGGFGHLFGQGVSTLMAELNTLGIFMTALWTGQLY